MPSSIGIREIVVLALVFLLLFATKKLPELGRSLGRGLREFKEGVTGKPKSLQS
jgi:sec-independent protein translocase protein TatA